MSEKRDLGRCPVCAGGDLRIHRPQKAKATSDYSITRAAYGASETLVRCACGIVFVHPLPLEETVKALYEQMEDNTYLKEETARRKMAERSLVWIERYARKGRVLDVGCFAGFFLDVARTRGWEGLGIEPSSWARRIATEQFHLHVLAGTLEENALESSSFDLVTFIDTLEHLRDPKRALLEAKRLLKEGGALYVSIPDIGSLTARLLGNAWWGCRREHLVYFSRKSLFRLLRELDWTVLSQRFYQRLFPLEGLLGRMKERGPLLRGASRFLTPFPRLRRWTLPVNFLDQLELIARKG